jgi:hypothetical protein
VVVFPPTIVPTALAAVMVVVVLPHHQRSKTKKEANLRQCQGKDLGQESKTKIYFHALHISSGLSHRYVCVQLIKQHENARIS